MLDDAIGSILGNNVGQRYIKAYQGSHWNFYRIPEWVEVSTDRNPLDLGLFPWIHPVPGAAPCFLTKGPAGQARDAEAMDFFLGFMRCPWGFDGIFMWYPALLKTPVRWLIGNFKHALVSSTPVGKRSYDHFWPLLDAWHNFWNWVTQSQTNWVPSHFSCPGSLVLCHGQKKVR